MMRTRFPAIALFLLAIVTAVGVVPPVAEAQLPVTGTADFRNAPQLAPGSYTDRIVSGDSAWYAVVYTNGTPYQFDVGFAGSAPSDVTLTASFVAPTLQVVDGPAQTVTGNGATYPDGHTNVWFLKVSIQTTGQPGIDYPVTIAVDGVQTLGREPCGQVSGCVLDDEYADIITQLNESKSALEATLGADSAEGIQSQIDNAKGLLEAAQATEPQVQAQLTQAEATMADLCAPDATCETFPSPGTKTPILGWIVGLAALGFGVSRALKKIRGSDEGDEDAAAAARKEKNKRTPTSLRR